MAKIETDDYLNAEDAAKVISKANRRLPPITASTVRRYCLNFLTGRTPALEALRWGRSWKIPRAEVERYAKERQGRGRPAAK